MDRFCFSVPITDRWFPPSCRYGAQCWRAGCVFWHGDCGDRQQAVACLAEFWSAAVVPQLKEGLVKAVGAVRVLQEEMCELKRILVERTERVRHESAEKHITSSSRTRTGDLERDSVEDAQMCDNASAFDTQQSLRLKLGLQGSRSTVPRQEMVKLGLHSLQHAVPHQSIQQWKITWRR